MQLGLFVLTATMAFAGPDGGSSSQPAPTQAKIGRCLVSLLADRQVSAQEAGLLVSLAIQEGSQVKENGLLGQINDSQAQMQKRVATAEHEVAKKKAADDVNVRYAEAAKRVAESEYMIKKTANDKVPGAVPIVEMQKLLLTVEQAALQIEKSKHEQTIARYEADAYEAKVDVAEDAINRRKILSPIDGEVVEIFVRPGEWVEPGNVVFRVLRMDRLRIEGFLNAAHFSPSEINARPVTVEVKLARGRTERFQGKVVFVNPVVQAGGDYRVWAEVDNRQENGEWLLRPGLEAEMTIDTRSLPALGQAPVGR
jgi:multidrug efflux pump subunit AcrA (membrane-fusion protein)